MISFKRPVTSPVTPDTVLYYNRAQVAAVLTGLRDKFRAGEIHAPLKVAVAAAFHITISDFTTEHFNAATLKRFERLFDIPTVATGAQPDNDQIAWAIQNFINRRSNPWASFERSEGKRDPLAVITASV